jgi:hypothetical protein
MMFSSEFDFGDKVQIDKGSVVGTVVGIVFYRHSHQILVAWWNNGDIIEKWIESERLEHHEKKENPPPPRSEPSVPFRKS